MTAIDVEKLLQPLSDKSPCGDDLEYDTAFQELERAATIDSGAAMLEDDSDPEPPKWPEVAGMAEALLTRTKDLRVGMYLAQARLNTHGVVGLADGVALIKGFLTTYWDDVHPPLDAEDRDGDTENFAQSLLELPEQLGDDDVLALEMVIQVARADIQLIGDIHCRGLGLTLFIEQQQAGM